MQSIKKKNKEKCNQSEESTRRSARRSAMQSFRRVNREKCNQ